MNKNILPPTVFEPLTSGSHKQQLNHHANATNEWVYTDWNSIHSVQCSKAQRLKHTCLSVIYIWKCYVRTRNTLLFYIYLFDYVTGRYNRCLQIHWLLVQNKIPFVELSLFFVGVKRHTFFYINISIIFVRDLRVF